MRLLYGSFSELPRARLLDLNGSHREDGIQSEKGGERSYQQASCISSSQLVHTAHRCTRIRPMAPLPTAPLDLTPP